MQIFKADRKKWLPILKSKIQPQELPQYYGGDLVDPDGDTRCPSKIKLGGKVPKSLYNKNQPIDQNGDEVKTAVIKKGKQMTIDFIVAEDNCLLKWDFRSEDHDIKFGVNYRDADGVENIAVPLSRIDCQHVNEVGFLLCKSPATYTVIFDNTYSVLRSKTIHYNIQLTIPIDQINVETNPDIEIGEEPLCSD